MGKGKTLWSVIYAMDYAKKYPNNPIYSNFHLDLPNAIYTPFLVLPYNKLEKSLVIGDDFFNVKNLDYFISIIASLSRKADLDIILTCQYYSMIPPILRLLGFWVEVCYNPQQDLLVSSICDMDGNRRDFAVIDAVKKAKKHYDTNEKVRLCTDDAVLDELRRFDYCNEDKIVALNYFFKNKTKIEKYKKLLNLI